jgi:hypothetical protein
MCEPEDDEQDEWALADQLDDGQLLAARIEIVRILDAEGNDLVIFRAEDMGGVDLPLVETLGLLRMTEDSAIRQAMGEA